MLHVILTFIHVFLDSHIHSKLHLYITKKIQSVYIYIRRQSTLHKKIKITIPSISELLHQLFNQHKIISIQ